MHLGVRVPDVRRTVRVVASERRLGARPDVLAVATALWPVGRTRRPAGGSATDTEVHEHCLVDEREFFVRKAIGWGAAGGREAPP